MAGRLRLGALGQGSIMVRVFEKTLSEAKSATAAKSSPPGNFMIEDR